MRHLLANLLDDKDYSDKQVRKVAKNILINMGTSIDMIRRNYKDKKDTGFDVDVLDEQKKRNGYKIIKNNAFKSNIKRYKILYKRV